MDNTVEPELYHPAEHTTPVQAIIYDIDPNSPELFVSPRESFFPVVVGSPVDEHRIPIDLIQTSQRHHVRAFEQKGFSPTIWSANNDTQYYSARDFKGANWEIPIIMANHDSYEIFGFQDRKEVDRAVRGSHALEQAGVETERIIHMIKPQEFIFQGKKCLWKSGEKLCFSKQNQFKQKEISENF